MKKFPIDFKYLKISIYVLLVICLAIAFEKTIGNINTVASNIKDFLKTAQGVFSSFIYGFFIAYFLNPIVKAIETKALVQIKFIGEKQRLRRSISIAITYIILIGFFVWTISYLLPEVFVNVRALIYNIQRIDFSSDIYDDNFVSQLLNGINSTFGTDYSIYDVINSIIEPVTQSLQDIPAIINMVWASTTLMASSLLKVIIGLIIALYMLFDKESIGESTKKILRTIFRSRRSEKLLHIFASGNIVFQNFIIGKALDSLIVGIIFFLTCMFLKPPYTLLLSVIVGITNMIPYFGPFIGAVPVVLIVLLYNPMLALWIAIDILIIQQFDGYVLGPKILGDSTGLKPLGVIFAITAGGALLGIFGMFLGVPLYAVIKKMGSEVMNRIYDKKYSDTNSELPEDNE